MIARFLKVLQPHLADSEEDFDHWFDRRDGILHQIAKSKSGSTPIVRDVTRQVLLEKTFESLRYVGQCVDVLMRVFADTIEPPLDVDERSMFEATYFGQTWLGGIPLAVLHRYLRPLREAVQESWLDLGNARHHGIVLRLLQYNAEMVRNRRQADRTYKQSNSIHTHNAEFSNDSETTDKNSQKNLLPNFDELAEELARVKGLKCPCGAADGFNAEIDSRASSEETKQVSFICRDCGDTQILSFSMEETRRIAKQMMND